MEFLGIGPLELFFIVVIALIILGPKDMIKAGRTLGRWLRSLVTSPSYHTIQQVSNEIRNLPNRLMREAGFDENGKPIGEQIRQELGMKEIEEAVRGVQSDINSSSSDLNKIIAESDQELQGAISDWTSPPVAQNGIQDWTTPPTTDPVIHPGNGDAPSESSSENPAINDSPEGTIISGPPPPNISKATSSADQPAPETPEAPSHN
jgi:Sec-independent protein translocase protein TatA